MLFKLISLKKLDGILIFKNGLLLAIVVQFGLLLSAVQAGETRQDSVCSQNLFSRQLLMGSYAEILIQSRRLFLKKSTDEQFGNELPSMVESDIDHNNEEFVNLMGEEQWNASGIKIKLWAELSSRLSRGQDIQKRITEELIHTFAISNDELLLGQEKLLANGTFIISRITIKDPVATRPLSSYVREFKLACKKQDLKSRSNSRRLQCNAFFKGFLNWLRDYHCFLPADFEVYKLSLLDL